MLKARYGISGVLKADAADVQYVTDSQMLLNEVAYLLRNAFKAQIDSPFSYPWAPFEVYFNPYLENIRGERFPSTDAAKRILGTHALIPENWEHRNGTILNKCFVDYRTSESMIGSGFALFNRVRKFDTESVIAQSHGVEELLTFTDNEMQEKIHGTQRFVAAGPYLGLSFFRDQETDFPVTRHRLGRFGERFVKGGLLNGILQLTDSQMTAELSSANPPQKLQV